jgi:acetylglutamate kinase
MEKLYVIKIGGKVIDDQVLLNKFLEDFAVLPGKKVLVHGGGKSASAMGEKLGIAPQMINGRRVTDKDTLEVVLMVYGGLVNKKIVASLQAHQINALGLTGADLNIITSKKRNPQPIDFGFVGDVTHVNGEVLADLIAKGITPVLAPLTHDKQGNMLNTNADTIASMTAIGLSAHFNTELVYCFEKNGVLRDASDDDSVIPNISHADFQNLLQEGVITEGMIPKLENAFNSIKQGVNKVAICNFSAVKNLSTEDTFTGTKLWMD